MIPKKESIKKIGISKNIPETSQFFSHLTIEEMVFMPDNLPDIFEIISVLVLPNIVSVEVIKSIYGMSPEGEKVGGAKLAIELEVREKLLYISNTLGQDIHSIENTYLKRVYISLPNLIEGTEIGLLAKYSKLKFKPYVFDIIANKVSPRTILVTSFLYIDVKYEPTYEICLCGYYEDKGSKIGICYDDGQNYRQIIGNPSKKILSSWSPDGQEIAFLSNIEGNHMLYLININDGKSIRITDPSVFDCITSYCWSNVANKIYLSAVKGESKDIYSIDVRNMYYEKLTHGEGLTNNYRPKCSNNGEKIAYIRSLGKENRLYVMDNNGLNIRQITSYGDVKDFDWCIDGRHIVSIIEDQDGRYGLFMVDIDSCSSEFLSIPYDVEGFRKIRCSPKGKYISYVAKGKDDMMENLYVYDNHSKKTIKLTNSIRHKTINDYIWKVDEEKIYFSAASSKGAIMYSSDIGKESRIHRIMERDFSYMTLSYRPRVI